MPEPPPPAIRHFRFGPFEFDPDSGELWRNEKVGRTLTRLSPQPARLLSHLIERRHTLVTRDEIRQLLWPGIEIEFEQGLHTCIRQIRSMLGDSATDPKFIETIPRRGYRFLGSLEGEGETRHPATAKAKRRPSRMLLGAAIGISLVLIILLSVRRSVGTVATPSRVAVMPLEPAGDAAASSMGREELGRGLAESVVEILANRASSVIEVIGPTTTQQYERSGGLSALLADLSIDYLLNWRQTNREGKERLFIEIIRGTDRAHVWGHYLDELSPDQEPAETIAAAVVELAEAGSAE